MEFSWLCGAHAAVFNNNFCVLSGCRSWPTLDQMSCLLSNTPCNHACLAWLMGRRSACRSDSSSERLHADWIRKLAESTRESPTNSPVPTIRLAVLGQPSRSVRASFRLLLMFSISCLAKCFQRTGPGRHCSRSFASQYTCGKPRQLIISNERSTEQTDLWGMLREIFEASVIETSLQIIC